MMGEPATYTHKHGGGGNIKGGNQNHGGAAVGDEVGAAVGAGGETTGVVVAFSL